MTAKCKGRARLLQLACAAAVAVISPAAMAAPTVTYILSPNDDGQGNFAAGQFALYAVDSTTDGNQGIAAFTVDVQGFSTISNLAPQAFYPTANGTVTEGFTLLRSADGVDPVRGTQDTVSTNRSLVNLVYGMGQTAGNLDALAPNGGAGGTGKVQPIYDARLLIASGTFANLGSLSFTPNSTSNRANVFVTNTDKTTQAAAVQTVTAMTDTYVGPTGSWTTAANWSPQVPQLSDNVQITGNSGGAVTVTYDAAATAVPLNRVTIDGTAGSPRTLAQTGNTFTTTHEYVGVDGVGSMAITGGTHNVTGAGTNGLYVGLNAGSSGTITVGGSGTLNVTGNLALGGAGSGTVNQSGGIASIAGALAIGSTGQYNLSGGSLTAANTANNGAFSQTGGTASLGPVSGTGSLTVATGTLTVASFAQNAVTVADGGKLQVLPAPTVATNTAGSLTLTGSGTLDLANHRLQLNTTDNIRAYITRAAGAPLPSGLNAWTGSGLTSSVVAADAANGNAKQLALGYFDSRDNANTGLNVPAGQTLVRTTVYGDATGDGKVSIADLSVWNNNFGASNPRWSQGDFNYDGKVNIADLSVWNNDFGANVANTGAGPTARAAAATAAQTLTAASASPAAAVAAGTVEMDVDTATGHVTLVSGGVTIAALEVDSNAGNLISANWTSMKGQKGLVQWSFPRGTPNANEIAEFVSDPTTASGQPVTLAAGSVVDYGNILPAGFSNGSDLTFTFNQVLDTVAGTTASRTGNIVFVSGVPEPTSLGLIGVAAVGLLGRRRRLR